MDSARGLTRSSSRGRRFLAKITSQPVIPIVSLAFPPRHQYPSLLFDLHRITNYSFHPS